MKRAFAVTALALLCLGNLAQADVFNLGPGLTNLEMVTVGDPGNAPDTRYVTPGRGGVGYTYRIGKYEVTAAQYCDFLNHKAKSDPYGLWDPVMVEPVPGTNSHPNIQRSGTSGSYVYSVALDWANRPMNCLTYWRACRFTNWLHNGQGDGDTETGAYTLNGYNGPDGIWIKRNVGAKWFLPTEDEWYKAAYYKAGGTNAGYWDYPTQSNSTPSNDLSSPDGGNNANFYQSGYSIGAPYWRTNVGEFENSESAYGTFDQGGNEFEIIQPDTEDTYAYRIMAGGISWWYSYLMCASDNGIRDYGPLELAISIRVAAQAVVIDTVPVGDPGNAGELSGAGAGGYGPNRICGSVGYNYNIGKHEVTAGQYTAFLNAVARTDTYALYDPYMADTAVDVYGCNIKRSGTSGSYTYSVASDWANRPVNYVSYWDACRFANWLHNGQPTGLQTAATTERGVYTLDGYGGQDGRAIQRNAGWKWAVTSEDEWYKAAYYKGGGTNAGYWDYPMQSDIPTTPSNDITNPDGGNNANFYQNGYTIGSPYCRTNVGEFENSESAYGTFDQGGNVWEWNEAIVYEGSNYAFRGLRGGGWTYYDYELRAWHRRNDINYPAYGYFTIGFRVSEVVPGPTVSDITPNSGLNTGSVSITDLAGTCFQTGATVKLTKSGQTDIAATGVTVVSATKITCTFDLMGKASGEWNVVVTNPDAQSAILTNGFTVVAGSIGLAKSLPTGSPVYIEDAVVTAPGLEAGCVFVESSDRSGGIKLVTNQAFSPGDRVKFTGLTGRVDGEYGIDGVVFTEPATPGAVLDPIFMTTRAAGNDTTETLNYLGINTTGLLVRIVGKVTGVITAQKVCYLDDGGNYQDGYGPVLGLRVHVPSGVSTSWNNKYYAITGISRVQKVTLTIWGCVNGDWYAPGTVIYVPYVDALSVVLLYP